MIAARIAARIMRATALWLSCAAVLATAAQTAQAQAVNTPAVSIWPTRPVKVVVPFSAAGTADLLARVMADKLSASLGQPFVLEHRPGAGGIIGQEQVARAAPDGYIVRLSSLGSFAISPVLTPVSSIRSGISPISPIWAVSRWSCSRRGMRATDAAELMTMLGQPRRDHLRDHLGRLADAPAA